MRKILLTMLLAICTLGISAQSASKNEATIVNNIQYKSNKDAYVNERCKLDIYYDKKQKDCPVVVWFHGGGLTSGSKQLPSQLMNQGYTIVGVNYRLLPTVTIDQCLDDCAAALAWVFKNIDKYNGSNKKILFLVIRLAATSQQCSDWTRNGSIDMGWMPTISLV